VGPVTSWLGALAALALAISILPRRRADHDDLVASYALAMVWVVGALARSIFGAWDIGGERAYLYAGPACDVMFLGLVVHLARWNSSRWLRILVGLATLQLLAHVAYGLGDKTPELRDTYKLTLNVSYIAELVCAATPGGLHGIRALFNRLRRSRRMAGQGLAR